LSEHPTGSRLHKSETKGISRGRDAGKAVDSTLVTQNGEGLPVSLVLVEGVPLTFGCPGRRFSDRPSSRADRADLLRQTAQFANAIIVQRPPSPRAPTADNDMERLAPPPVQLLAVSGSVRKFGTTARVLDYVAQVAHAIGASTTIIHLSDFSLAPCGTCADCNTRQSPCELNDEMKGIVNLMRAADALLYASPVHAFGLAHPMQNFLERAGVCYLRFERPLTNKVGGAIVVGRRYSHSAAYAQLLNNLFLNRLIIVGSGYPPCVNATSADDVMTDHEGVDSVRRLVERMVRLAQLLKTPAVAPHFESLLHIADGTERTFADIAATSGCQLEQP